MGLVGSRMRRYIRNAAPEAGELKAIAGEQERIFDQWVAYLRSMKQDTMNVALTDVQDLVQRAVEAVRPRSGARALHYATEPSLPQVKADPAMLREAVTNLVVNALEAVQEDGRVGVQTGYDAGSAAVYIEVEDNGPGISRAEQARVFDPGYSTKPKGNGYGLSICSRIVAAHRGDLRVISRPGAGAVFRIDLPVDFEIVLEEESIGLQPVQLDRPRGPLTEEFIE
jgi:signal transduction histidine kinase